VYYDGAWGNTGARNSAILISPSGMKLRYAAWLQFTKETDKCINNIAEYELVLLGLWKLNHKQYSKVIVGQIDKECLARDGILEKYLAPRKDNEKILQRILSRAHQQKQEYQSQ
jgi:hypothetical protein